MIGPPGPCAYLPELRWRFEYFFAAELDGTELESYLSRGWRKFGLHYFRPRCSGCLACVPLRVRVRDFLPTKSQRRVLRKGTAVSMTMGPLDYDDELFEVYRDHSWNRFGKHSSPEEFIDSFFVESCPSLISRYRLNGELIAVGFLDRSDQALSSVYFTYRGAFDHLGLGNLSVMREIEYARSQGMEYYYLGYHIAQNRSMAYKNRFHPHETMDWETEQWTGEEPHSLSPE